MKRKACERVLLVHWERDAAIPDGEYLRHVAECPSCSEAHALAVRLDEVCIDQSEVVVPAGMSRRIVARVLADRRSRQRFRSRVRRVLALAAAVVVGFLGLYSLSPEERTVRETAAVLELPVPSLNERVAEARSAVAQLTRRTADETLESTLVLIPRTVAPAPLPPAPNWQEALEPSTRSLREAGQVVSSGFDPVASSARRAFDLFMSEMPPTESSAKPGL